MPDMDGVEAASRIGKLGLPKMPRIIAVTADVSRSARERLAGAGIAKVVSKPILVNALREAIEDDPAQETTATQLAAGALIDRHFLDDQKELLGPAQIEKLHHLLETTSAMLIEDIDRAATAGDSKRLARSAHQLGSAAGALGLVRLFDRSREIELAAPSMSLPEVRGRCPRTRRASRGVDAHAERSAPAGRAAFGELADPRGRLIPSHRSDPTSVWSRHTRAQWRQPTTSC